MPVLLLVHTPPDVASLNAEVDPAYIELLPEIPATVGSAVMVNVALWPVMDCVQLNVEITLVSVYTEVLVGVTLKVADPELLKVMVWVLPPLTL